MKQNRCQSISFSTVPFSSEKTFLNEVREERKFKPPTKVRPTLLRQQLNFKSTQFILYFSFCLYRCADIILFYTHIFPSSFIVFHALFPPAAVATA